MKWGKLWKSTGNPESGEYQHVLPESHTYKSHWTRHISVEIDGHGTKWIAAKQLHCQWLENFHTFRVRYRDYLGEFIGTACLVCMGTCVSATATLYISGDEVTEWLFIAFGWGLALAMAIFVSGGVSGGHLNPSFTIVMALFRGFPWKKVPGYIVSQILGAYVGGALAFAYYYSSIDHYDGGVRQTMGTQGTASIFVTFPQPWITVGTAFLSETYCTAILVFCIFAIIDPHNLTNKSFIPLAVGMVVVTIGMSAGFQSGYSMNQARDLGPRLFLSSVGYGWEPWTARDYYAWVPTVSPLLGALLGGTLYDFLIYHPRVPPVPQRHNH
ncbi:glycerol channel [Dispira simplex]|nr:glycerol channel [Dispira simplex]